MLRTKIFELILLLIVLFCPIISFSNGKNSADNYIASLNSQVEGSLNSYSETEDSFKDHQEAGKVATIPNIPKISTVKLSSLFSNLSIPRYNDQIQFFINYYKTYGKWELENAINRMVALIPIIKPYIEKYQLPLEVLILGIIESSYHPNYSSMEGGKGLWNISKFVAKAYNLEMNDYLDERMDLKKSTDVTFKRFKELLKVYNNNIDFSLAAYAGAGTYLNKKIRENKTHNFWSIIKSPSDFKNRSIEIVPRFYAILSIIRSAQYYQFHIDGIQDHTSYLGELKAYKNGVSFSYLAKKTNIPVKLLMRLNPHLYRSYTVGGANVYVPDKKIVRLIALRIRKGRASRLKWLPSGHTSYRVARNSSSHKKYYRKKPKRKSIYYKVRPKDSLYSIARKYNTTVSNIRSINKLKENVLSVGKLLKIRSKKSTHVSSKRKSSKKVSSFIVRKGDTLYSIAKRYNTNINKIYSKTGSNIHPGDVVYIHRS